MLKKWSQLLWPFMSAESYKFLLHFGSGFYPLFIILGDDVLYFNVYKKVLIVFR